MKRKSQKEEKEPQLYREIVENMAEGVFLIRASDSIIVYANSAVERIFGYASWELIGKHISTVNAAAEKKPEEVAREIMQSLKVNGIWRGELLNLKKDGTSFWSHVNISTFEHPEHGAVFISINQDITERKRAEEKLRESETRYRQLVEGAPDIVYTFSSKRGGIYYSSRVEQVLGYSAKYLYAHPLLWNESIHPNDRLRISEIIREFRDGNFFDIEYRIQDAHENWLWLRDRSIGHHVGNDEVLIEGVATDITERKRVEISLQESEERYRALVETQPELICRWLPDTTLTFVNKAYCDFFGRTQDELLGKSWLFMIPENDRDKIRKYCAELALHPAIHEYEHQATAADGTVRWQAWSDIPILDLSGRLLEFQSIGRDITERRQAEEELRESEERLRQIIEQMPYPVEICDPSGTAKMVNQAFLKLFSVLSADLIVDKYNVFNDPLTMEVMGLADDIRRVYAGESVFVPEVTLPLAGISPEFKVQHAENIILEISMFPVFRGAGEVWRVVTIWKDITERKRLDHERESLLVQITAAHDEVTKAKDLLNGIMERVSDGFVAFDTDFNYTYVNTHGGDLLGRKPEDLIGKNYWVEYPEARGTPFANAYARAMETQQPIFFEDYYVHWDRWFVNRIYPSKDGISIFFTDVTERKQAEENLRKREQEYKMLVEHTPDVIVRFDRQYRHIYVNPIVEKEFGISSAKLLGKTHRERGQPTEMADWSEGLIRQVFETGREITFELTNPTPAGNKYFLSRGVPEFAEDGSVVSVLFIHHNITERKRVEDQLRQAEAKYRDIFENAIEGIFQSAPDGHFISVNTAMARIFGYETPEEMITSVGNNISTRIHADPNRRVEFVRALEQTGAVKQFEAKNLHKDGNIIWTRTSARIIRDANGAVLYYEGFVEDITERRRVEDTLRESQDLFSLFMRHSPIYTYIKTVTSTESRVVQASDNFQEMIGISSADMVGKTVEDLFPPELAAKITADDWAVVSKGYVLKVDEDLKDRHYTTIKFPLLQGDKTLLGGYTIDITERKQTEEKLKEANKHLEEQLGQIKILRDYLREQTIRDPLTGLYNRRYLHDTMERELSRAKRQNYPVSVMMMDIDHFKDFNDVHGHQAGDEILIALGSLLRSSVRQGDIACRYGGEEFIIILLGMDNTDTQQRAETIRLDFNNLRVNFDGSELHASISIGVAFYPKHGNNMNEIIKIADAALYEAKQAGRNLVYVWNEK
jgi:diguanylate cyclase (GGDEF)-like protein/PAS domain S-box-containing protein